MLIIGMAPIPFDPNDLPVSTDKEPWWKVVQSFYADDLRFDDEDDDNDDWKVDNRINAPVEMSNVC